MPKRTCKNQSVKKFYLELCSLQLNAYKGDYSRKVCHQHYIANKILLRSMLVSDRLSRVNTVNPTSKESHV